MLSIIASTLAAMVPPMTLISPPADGPSAMLLYPPPLIASPSRLASEVGLLEATPMAGSISPASFAVSLSAPKKSSFPWEEVVSSVRSVLNVTEKALDGLPIYGPKAAVASVAEVLKSVEV